MAGPSVAAVVTVGGGASIPLMTQRLSEHSRAPVVTTPQPALDAAVGAALIAAYGSAADAQTGVAPRPPVGRRADRRARFGHLPRVGVVAGRRRRDEPVPYTGEDSYDTDVTPARPPVQYVPPTGPIEEPRTWQRLPQLVFGLAAAVALIAVGGVAIALTSATNSTNATDPPSTASSAKPPSAEPPPPRPRVPRPSPSPASRHCHRLCRHPPPPSRR